MGRTWGEGEGAMKRINIKNKRVFIASSLLLLAVVGMTIAFYTSYQEFRNPFRTVAPGVAIEEKFDSTDFWVPEEEKTKQISFTNTGSMDMYLRFKVKVEWENSGPKDDNTELWLSDKDTQAEANQGVITLYWRDSNTEGGPQVLHEKIDNDLIVAIPGVEEDENGNEKKVIYYYYKEVLKAGASTQHVLESVQFSPNLSNDGHDHSNYSNIQINVSLEGETILANPEAAEDVWKIKPTEEKGKLVWTKPSA